ncbi:MAG: hypothetical protein WAM39_08335 [Bryobacteraceae bacterium]
MPLDSTRWKSIEISGTYPQARYFSFIPYVAQGTVVNNQALNDVDIDPSQGSTNPFRENADDGSTHFYTVTASRYPPTSSGINSLQFGDTRLAGSFTVSICPTRGWSEMLACRCLLLRSSNRMGALICSQLVTPIALAI